MSWWEGEEPIREPLGREPDPIMAVRGLMVALSAHLSRRLWWRWGMGRSEGDNADKERRPVSVSWRLE